MVYYNPKKNGSSFCLSFLYISLFFRVTMISESNWPLDETLLPFDMIPMSVSYADRSGVIYFRIWCPTVFCLSEIKHPHVTSVSPDMLEHTNYDITMVYTRTTRVRIFLWGKGTPSCPWYHCHAITDRIFKCASFIGCTWYLGHEGVPWPERDIRTGMCSYVNFLYVLTLLTTLWQIHFDLGIRQ